MSTFSLQRLAAKLSGKTTLQTVLIVPFLLQVFAAVGIVGYLSYKNSQRAVNDLADQLMGEVSNRIEQNLRTYLQTPHQINQSKLDAVKLGFVNMKDLSAWEKYLWRQVQLYPYINFTSIANLNGEYRSGEKMSDGTLLINASGPSTKFNFYSYNTNDTGDRTKVSATIKNFDIRQNPFYKDAALAAKPTWSSVDISLLEPTLIVSALQPVYNKKQLEGVLITALRLDSIGKFLNSIKIGKSGQTFIIERKGTLLATSTSEKPFRTKNGKKEQFQVKESSDLVTQSTAKYLASHFRDLQQITKAQFCNKWQAAIFKSSTIPRRQRFRLADCRRRSRSRLYGTNPCRQPNYSVAMSGSFGYSNCARNSHFSLDYPTNFKIKRCSNSFV
jgi:hypothetical protein